MPRDVDPAVAGLPGVWVVDVDRMQHEPSAHAAAADVDAGRHIVAAEVAAYLAGQRMAEVTPTVTALRQRAADVVEAELLRLDNRLPGLESAQREEVARTVRRVVDKLLHAPTVRIKQLASAPGGDSYAEALRELFELDQTAVDAVATAGELPVVSTGFDAGTHTAPRRPAAQNNPPSSRLAHVIRIGTRGSLLATTQAAVIRDALIANGHPAELVIISTAGDQSSAPIESLGCGRLHHRVARGHRRWPRRRGGAFAQGFANRRGPQVHDRGDTAPQRPARRAGGPRRAGARGVAGRFAGGHVVPAAGRAA